jgi:type I restriction enzyme, S subunit
VNYINQHRFDESPEIQLKGGDVLLAKDGSTLGTVNVVRRLPRPATVNSSIAVITPGPRIDSVYLYYLFASSYMENTIQRIKGGMGVPHLFQEDLNKFYVPLPLPREQTAIATFLDRETAKIDSLIAEQQRLIELLQEKRQAVIFHAVTKGLNPDAPLKDSGNTGIGRIPTHWNVYKMKWVARMESGHTPDKKIEAYWENCEIPWVSLNDTGYLKDHDYISDTAYRVNELGIANSSARLLPAQVVVFSRDATIGRCAITTRPMAVSQHFIAWVCSDAIVPEYLLMRLRSMTQELDRLTTGATLKTIGMPDVRTLQTPVPPVAEQKHIVSYIHRTCDDIDLFIAEAGHAVTLLQERRSALISAAVTGQIDVRGLLGSEAA